jgi:hypothetical protein
MTVAEVEARLRAELPLLADRIAGAPIVRDGEDVVSPVEVRRRRPMLVALVAACVVVALVAATVALAMRGGDDATPRPATRGTVTTARGWHELRPAGLGPRAGVTPLWTGTEVVVLGGVRSGGLGPLALTDGAAYNPRTGAWRALRTRSSHPGASSVWAGDRVVWFAKQGGGSFDPRTGESESFPLIAPGLSGFRAAVSMGSDAFGLLVSPSSFQLARFDAATNAWDLRAAHPVELSSSVVDAVWTGAEVVVWDGATRGWAYSPVTNSWRDLPPLPVGADTGVASSVAWVDGRLFVVYAFDGANGRHAKTGELAGDVWSIDQGVWGGGFAQPRAVTDGHRLAVVDAEGTGASAFVETLAGGGTKVVWTASPLPPGAGTTAVWTPTGLFLWGGLPADTPSTFDNPSPNEPEAAWFTP